MKLARIIVCLAAVVTSASLTTSSSAQQQTGQLNRLAPTNDKPIQIESDNLEIREQEKKALFKGNVKVVQGAMTLSASNMVVYYKGNSTAISVGGGDIDKIEVDGNVSLISGTQSARGDQGAFDMRSEVLQLRGKQVVLADGQNVLTGCSLDVEMKTGQARLNACKGGASGGRVKMMIDPKAGQKNN